LKAYPNLLGTKGYVVVVVRKPQVQDNLTLSMIHASNGAPINVN